MNLLLKTNLSDISLPRPEHSPVAERDDLCSGVWQSANMINDFSPANF